MFAACDDAAFREFFDKGSCQAGDLFGITRQASVRNDGPDFTEIEYRGKIDVESRSFEFRRDDARSDAQLRRAGIGKLRHRWNRSEHLLQTIHASTLMIDGEERLGRKHLSQTAGQTIDLVEAFDIPLKQKKAAGTHNVKDASCLA